MKFILIAFSAFIGAAAIAQETSTSKLDSVINANVTNDTPGLFVGVVMNGEIIYEGYGIRFLF